MLVGLILAIWVLVVPALIFGARLARASAIERAGSDRTLVIEVGKSDYRRQERALRLVAPVSDVSESQPRERQRIP